MGFFAKYKKIIFIILFLAIVFVLGYLIINTFFKSSLIVEPRTEDPVNIGGLVPADDGSGLIGGPSSGDGQLNPDTNIPGRVPVDPGLNIPSENEPSDLAIGGITRLSTVSSGPALDPFIGSDNSLRYYNRNDGKFYKLDNNGNLVTLSDTVFHQVRDVTWANSGNKAILEYPDGNKIVYDFLSKKQVTLPKHWEDFSFSPSGDKISAKSMADDIENRHLIVANADGSRAQSLSLIGNNADSVYPIWSPNNQAAAMYTRGVDFNRQEVFFVGLNNENFKSTIINGRGFDPQWSTTGDRLLYSVYSSDNNMNPRLWIVDAQGDNIGQNRGNLGLDTWASKCTFATNNEVYCAVPENMPQGAGLFPELADQTRDLLYKIDLSTGTKKLIAIPENAVNVSNIMVPSSQDKIYFTDFTTGLIYSINLK
jgi:hypothetical protein